MRHAIIAASLAATLAIVSTGAAAKGFSFTTDTCKYDYGTLYDVDVTAAGLSFHRDSGTPSRIFLHDGALKVDGRDTSVSAADAAALRRYEDGVRRLLPEVAAVAREGIDMGYSAMTTVTMTFAEPGQRDALLAKLRRKQAEALRSVDQGVGAGHWSSDRMTGLMADSISDSVGELVGSVTSSAVTAALSGDTAKVASLQARAASLDKALNGEMDKRSKDLEARSNGICPRLNDLAELQRGWRVRLPDGSPLELMSIKPKSRHDDDSDGDRSDKKIARS